MVKYLVSGAVVSEGSEFRLWLSPASSSFPFPGLRQSVHDLVLVHHSGSKEIKNKAKCPVRTPSLEGKKIRQAPPAHSRTKLWQPIEKVLLKRRKREEAGTSLPSLEVLHELDRLLDGVTDENGAGEDHLRNASDSSLLVCIQRRVDEGWLRWRGAVSGLRLDRRRRQLDWRRMRLILVNEGLLARVRGRRGEAHGSQFGMIEWTFASSLAGRCVVARSVRHKHRCRRG